MYFVLFIICFASDNAIIYFDVLLLQLYYFVDAYNWCKLQKCNAMIIEIMLSTFSCFNSSRHWRNSSCAI